MRAFCQELQNAFRVFCIYHHILMAIYFTTSSHSHSINLMCRLICIFKGIGIGKIMRIGIGNLLPILCKFFVKVAKCLSKY